MQRGPRRARGVDGAVVAQPETGEDVEGDLQSLVADALVLLVVGRRRADDGGVAPRVVEGPGR
nr:hypothetical protein [Streptomyces sp. V3I8]